MKRYKEYQDDLQMGDLVYTGRFKNKKATVTGFDTDDKGQPIVKTTKGTFKLYSVRIAKLMPEKQDFSKIEKSKLSYQKALLKSSYIKKFEALKRLQEKAFFFDRIKYKLNETFSLPKLIDILNELKEKNIIEEYVIGGASALLYYSTPHLTEDIDVFISIKQSSKVISFSSLYNYLKKNYNAKEEREYVLIDNNPIQFLVPEDKLTQEAFNHPNKVKIQGKTLQLFSLEYLIAIMLYLNKPKYRERLRIVKEENNYNSKKLSDILKKYKLEEKWEVV